MNVDLTSREIYNTMPSALKYKLRLKNALFLVVVVVPTALAVLYFGFLASDVYVSESKFIVRSPDKPAPAGIGVILQSAGFSDSGNEIYAAQSFASSRDGLRAINRDNAVLKAYTRPEISIFDRFNPWGLSASFERLYEYYQDKIAVQNDSTTAITTLSVRAFDPEDARKFNEQLLELSEATVNRLHERGRTDLVRYGEQEVATAKARAQSAASSLAAYRNISGIVDPEKQAEAQMEMITKLQDQLIAAQTELAQLRRFTPENPRIPVVTTLVGSLRQQINQASGAVAGNRRSLSARAVRYQRLALENEVAGKQLAAALASLEQARTEALRKQAYVERIVQPNLPDAPTEPRRLRGILATLFLSLVAYGILRMLLAGVREHAQ
jgi:capsular polysaccharide transport system permease protein